MGMAPQTAVAAASILGLKGTFVLGVKPHFIRPICLAYVVNGSGCPVKTFETRQLVIDSRQLFHSVRRYSLEFHQILRYLCPDY